jgi:hypothetical protein
MSKLLDVVRNLLRTGHYSYRTEQTYINWIRQFIIFHSKRHPAENGSAGKSLNSSPLVVNRHVASSTAFAASIFRAAHLFCAKLCATFITPLVPNRLKPFPVVRLLRAGGVYTSLEKHFVTLKWRV